MRAVTINRWLLLLGLVLQCHWVKGTTCPSPELSTKLDPASKAYIAPVVFHGVLLGVNKSGSEGLKVNYRIEKIHKRNSESKLLANTNAVVIYPKRKMRNRDKSDERETAASCQLHVREKDLRKDQVYIVYVKELSSSTLLGVSEPVPHTKKAIRSIRKVLIPGNAKPAKLKGLKGVRIEPKNRIRLKCKIEGYPVPWVDWFRDGKKIKSTDRIRIRSKRKDTRLLIRKAVESDSGRYECRAKNVLNKQTVSLSATVIVTSTAITTPLTTLIYEGEECKETNYCLNGGTCIYFRSIRELSCHCADGYKGKRCESKDISPVGVVPKVSVDLDETTRVLQTYWGK